MNLLCLLLCKRLQTGHKREIDVVVLPRIIGHRGASAYAPENTLAAFQKAKNMGCCCIEFDVMLNRDGDTFVFHDERLDRTTNGRGEFHDATTQQIKSLDAGAWFSIASRGEKIPEFREILSWLLNENMQANIEIKPYPGTTEQTVTKVISQLLKAWPSQRPWPLVSSFDYGALLLCQQLAPQLPLGFLMHHWDKDWESKARGLNCYSINLNHRILSKARVQGIKQKGFQVLVYTVNRKSLADKLFEWGVDAVFSDYPDLLTKGVAC